MTTREERSRWLVSLLRQALVEAGRNREKLDMPTLMQRACEYGGTAVPKPTVNEFADLMRARSFDDFDPDYRKWTEAVAWNLRLDPQHSVCEVVSAMTDMGFTVLPPPGKRYEVLYNGTHVAQFDELPDADVIADRPGYKVIDHDATG